MAKYTTKLMRSEEVALGTKAFFLEKPAGFNFLAGQHAEYALVNPPETDAEGNKRFFSFVSAPYEEYLTVATRMRDTAFKRVLGKLPPGSPIEMEGPFGDLVLHEKKERPAIFVVGGIGITPFMSIIKDAVYRRAPQQMYLFYSNRRPADAPFLAELVKLDEENKNFTLIATMSDMEKTRDDWHGEVGYIHMGMIDKYVPERDNAMYYMAGPEKMVAAMREMLNKGGVSNDDIKTEEFSGY